FKVEYLGIERWQIKLPSKEEVIRTYKTRRWARKNWNELIKYLDKGGRTLTQSRLVVKAWKTT
ncbi:MAG: hypothetical protein V3T58_07175, partial [Candidatus Hydrothermarchaeales archaeon]